jgi:WD40-like Beta Propeller Repeat
MGKFARVSVPAVASLGAVLALCAPAGSGGRVMSGPDGLLVLGTVGSRDRSGAVTSERVLVADPRDGTTRSQRLPAGTLCTGVVRSGGDGVVFPSYSGRPVVARTLPLDLRGQPRSLGRAWTPDRDRARLTVPAPPGTRPIPWISEALSPDGRRLALAVRTSSGVRAAIADLADGSWEIVRGARVVGYRSIAWSPSGRWLVFTAGDRRLMAWRSPAEGAGELPVRVPGTIMSLATAG